MTTEVLKYYVHEITEGKEWAVYVRDEQDTKRVDHMALGHDYYRKLLAAHVSAREEYRRIRRETLPSIAALESEVAGFNDRLEEILQDIRNARRKASAPRTADGPAHPQRLPATGAQREEIERLRDRQKSLYAEFKERRSEFDALLAPAAAEYERRTTGCPIALIEQIAELGRQLKAAKRTRDNPDVPALKRALSDAKKRKKDISPKTHAKRQANMDTLGEMLVEDWPEPWKAVMRSRQKRDEQCKKLRAESGLTHGTYSAVEDAVKTALKTSEGDPHVKGFRARKIGLQIQNKPLSGEAFKVGSDDRLRIVSCERSFGRRDPSKRVARRDDPKRPSNRQLRRHAVARMRLAKDRYVSMAVLLHRDIPDDARITWAYLVPRIGGDGRTRYSLQLTVNLSRPMVQRSQGAGDCVVRLGWSMDPEGDGIVVARANGEAVTSGARIVKRTEIVSDIRGWRDKWFEGSKGDPGRGVRDVLALWIQENPSLVPDWMVEATSAKSGDDTHRKRGSLRQWKNHRALARIARRWVQEIPGLRAEVVGEQRHEPRAWREKRSRWSNRFSRTPRTRLQQLWVDWCRTRDAMRTDYENASGDYHVANREVLNAWLSERHGITDPAMQMAIWLEWWRRKDAHLERYARELEIKARAERKNRYRCVAAKLSQRYGRVLVDKFDLRQAARHSKTDEEADELNERARWQRTVASPSEFIECLQAAFGPERFKVRKRERSGDEPDPGGARGSPGEHENRAESVAGLAAAE
jgi:hypothetical protein